MKTIKSKDNPPQYHCCFCRHFQLEGYRWGYCKMLDVYVKGNLDACSVAIPPFSDTGKKN